jgi:hypothetical protein
MCGHIGGVQQDSRDTPVGVANRLIDVIHEPLSGVLVGAEPDSRLAAADRFPGIHDLDEYFFLVGQFRQRLRQRPAEQIPAAYQAEAGVIGEFDNQVGPGQEGQGCGQAREQFSHESEPICQGLPLWDRDGDFCPPDCATYRPARQDIASERYLWCLMPEFRPGVRAVS